MNEPICHRTGINYFFGVETVWFSRRSDRRRAGRWVSPSLGFRPKSWSKLPAVQTLREEGGACDVAERLDCVRLAAAFAAADPLRTDEGSVKNGP